MVGIVLFGNSTTICIGCQLVLLLLTLPTAAPGSFFAGGRFFCVSRQEEARRGLASEGAALAAEEAPDFLPPWGL